MSKVDVDFDFKWLKKKQKKLDNYIGESKGINMDQHVEDRNKALLVEFGEFINEVPELFKYWSNKKMKRDEALEEFVDGIHFLISLSNDLGIEEYEYNEPKEVKTDELVLSIYYKMSVLLKMNNFKELMDEYLYLGYSLGFTNDEIIDFYRDKNDKNYERQNNGY